MFKKKVLDKGFVKLLNISSAIPRDDEYYRDGFNFSARDTDPAKCARISFDNFDKERSEEQDLKLVEYLMKNYHNTPIEMTEIWLEMKLPIFIARQFVRHRTTCINEVSARYSILPEDWYIPKKVGGKPTNGMKQGQEDNVKPFIQWLFKKSLNINCWISYKLYLFFVNLGVAREHARSLLHLNHYTHWIWKQDLHNLMHFLALRLDHHSQIEAREYAQAVYSLLKFHLPKTMEFFDKYKRIS